MSRKLSWRLKRRQLVALVAISLLLGNSFFPFLGWSAVKPSSTPAQVSQSEMWGLVYVKGAHPDDQMTMTVVTDTSKIENIADLDVVFFQVPKELRTKPESGNEAQTTASLDGDARAKVSVNLGDGPQPADKPIIKKVPWNAAMMAVNIVLTEMPSHSLGGGTIPINTTGTNPTTTPTSGETANPTYHMPSITTPGAATVVEGPNSGNMDEMSATINGEPMIPLAALSSGRSNGESFYFQPKAIPPAPTGSEQSIVRFQGGKGMPVEELPTAVGNVSLQANQEMVIGQTEKVTVVVHVSGVKDWSFGAPPAALVNSNALRDVKELEKDSAKNRGAIVVKFEDCTPDVVQARDTTWVFHKENFVDGVATESLEMRAEKWGHWRLKVWMIPELPESTGQAVPNSEKAETPLASDKTSDKLIGPTEATENDGANNPAPAQDATALDNRFVIEDAVDALLTNTDYGKSLVQTDPKLIEKVAHWQNAKSDLAIARQSLEQASQERKSADEIKNFAKSELSNAKNNVKLAYQNADRAAKDPDQYFLDSALTQFYGSQTSVRVEEWNLEHASARASEAARHEDAARNAVNQALNTADDAAKALDPELRTVIERLEKADAETATQPSVEDARDVQPPSPSTQQR